MTVAAAWIADDWIYSQTAEQHAKYWIDKGWIWGPVGAADVNTKYWIADGWIWGPAGDQNVMTGYYIHDDWIFGPDVRLPFVG